MDSRTCVKLLSPMLAAVFVLVGCGDDDGPASDQGSVVELGADTGPGGDGPAGDGPSPDGPSPDGPVTDGDTPPLDGGVDGAPSFDLELSIGFGLLVTCSPVDTNKDCKGELYLSVHDKPVSATSVGTPIFQIQLKNVSKGSVVTAKGVPLAAKLYIAAFLDDDANVDPKQIAPDKGDPVYLDQTPFTAKPGQTVKRKLDFQIRLP